MAKLEQALKGKALQGARAQNVRFGQLQLRLHSVLRKREDFVVGIADPNDMSVNHCSRWSVALPEERASLLPGGLWCDGPAALGDLMLAPHVSFDPHGKLHRCCGVWPHGLQSVLTELSRDPQGLRSFVGNVSLARQQGSGQVPAVLDLRSVIVPCGSPQRLVVLCAVVGSEPVTSEEELQLRGELDILHRLIVAILNCSAPQATDSSVVVKGVSTYPALNGGAPVPVCPNVSFRAELLDQETFSTAAMARAGLPAMLVELFIPPGAPTLPQGVYCASWENLGALVAVHRNAGNVAAEMCLLRRGEKELVQPPDGRINGQLEGLQWLRPFYSGLPYVSTEALRAQVKIDAIAACESLWPGSLQLQALDLSAKCQDLRSISVSAVGSAALARAVPDQHVVAQAVLQYCTTLDLSAVAICSKTLGDAAERWVLLSLAAELGSRSRKVLDTGCKVAALFAPPDVHRDLSTDFRDI